ncbi:MAG: hypothetical protein ACK559_07915 [bacterium]
MGISDGAGGDRMRGGLSLPAIPASGLAVIARITIRSISITAWLAGSCGFPRCFRSGRPWHWWGLKPRALLLAILLLAATLGVVALRRALRMRPRSRSAPRPGDAGD